MGNLNFIHSPSKSATAVGKVSLLGALLSAALVLGFSNTAAAAVVCNEADTVGGGALGISSSTTPKAPQLGWNVGNGQCNGSFTKVVEQFTAGGIELGLRAEQRSVGQVPRVGINDYTVQVGADLTNATRAWWNFQLSVAYNGVISSLESLTLKITTQTGTNLPTLAAGYNLNLAALRTAIDARNYKPSPTTGYSELYQVSQNPVFAPWFIAPYNMAQEGAWVLTLKAVEGGLGGKQAEVSICIHTPAASCDDDNDGVYNADDLCADTPVGAKVGGNGCSLAQLCPCEGAKDSLEPWKNHGQYMSCVAQASNNLKKEGVLSEEEKKAAATSSCGK